MNPRPISAKAIYAHTLLVEFNNGEVKEVDILPFFKYPMFSLLNDDSFFKQVKADGMTVFWNDDIDIDPDYLYEKGISVKKAI